MTNSIFIIYKIFKINNSTLYSFRVLLLIKGASILGDYRFHKI
jgi:hypothetical protein